jgi:tetratricopeptide (TPR) repeat protein
MAAMKLGYVDEAMNAFEPLLKRNPVNRLAYWFLGLAYLNVNRRADAVALAQKLQTADKKLGDELAKVIADWK